MPRKISPLDFDHAIEVYRSTDKTLAQAGAEVGIGASTLSSELERRGIEAKSRKIALPVSEIVAAHDGSVSIEDRRSGAGTVVTVQLPLAGSPDSSR